MTVDMPATYDDYIGDFEVQLWKADGGFCLNLNHEYSNRLDELHEEILVPALSRYEEDDFLDIFYNLFGNLKHYRREESRTNRPSCP